MDSKYIEEAKKIEKEQIIKDEVGDKYCKDNDIYHYEWDSLIIKILKENGYVKISKMYEKAREWFWYN